MSAGERVIIEVNGQSAKARRFWVRPTPGRTPSGQATIPPREYREVRPDLAVKIGEKLIDSEEESEVGITYIRRLRKASGAVRELILRCE